MPPDAHDPEPSADGLLLQQHCFDSAERDRAGALEQLCRAHPDRARSLREIYQMLDEFGLVDEPVAANSLPERIGPYRIVELLGLGGMGVVYLAEHEQLGRRVALKVIHAAMAQTPKARERFRREALAASRLDHPGICPVYEVGSADGAPFLAMRHVRGRTLATAIAAARAAGRSCLDLPRADGATDQAAILRFGELAAAALHTAHEAGLVHRDVKPGNLIVTPDGAPVLLDFGLASMADSDGALTLTGDQVGTPFYMAPEQVAGQTTDRRADVYALGVVLYECLTLRPPFDAANRHDLFSQILSDDAPDPRGKGRGIRRDLWTVLQTALAKEPERRYRSAQALAEDLRRVRMHEPILARRAGPWLRVQRFVRRHPVAAGFVLFLLTVVAAFAVLLEKWDAALTMARADEQALRARDHGAVSPRRGIESALAAVVLQENVDTRSALYAAVLDFHEHAVLPHGRAVWAADFSPDGRRILTWSDDDTVRLWGVDGPASAIVPFAHKPSWGEFASDGRFLVAAHDGTLTVFAADGVRELWSKTIGTGRTIFGVQALFEPAAGEMIWIARFSPDGNRIAVTCSDRQVRVFDAHTGALLGEPWRHEQPCLGLAWSHDGTRLATATYFNEFLPDTKEFEVVILELTAAGPQPRLRLPMPAPVFCPEFAIDDCALLVSSQDDNARVFDLAAPATPPVVLAGAHFATFAPDGQRIAAGSLDGYVRTWTRDGRSLAAARTGPIRDVVWDGDRILVTGDDYAGRVFDEDLHELLVLRGHRERVLRIRLAPDRQRVSTASWDRTARVWDLVDPDLPRFRGHGGCVRALARLPDGNIASAGEDRTLRVWSPSGVELRRIQLAAPASTLALPPARSGDHRILVGHDDAIARIHDLTTGQELARFPDERGRGVSATFLADGRVLTSGYNERLHVFAPDGSERSIWGPPGGTIYALARAERSGLVAGGGWANAVQIWNEAGEREQLFFVSDAWTNALAFSPDEAQLAVGSSDGVVRIWRVLDSGRRTKRWCELDGHAGKVLAVAWSPDGAWLAAGVSDGSVHLWRVDTPSPVRHAILRGHGGAPVHAVLFVDDRHFLSGAADGAIQTWTASFADLTAIARRRLESDLASPTRAQDAQERAMESWAQRITAADADGDAARLHAIACGILEQNEEDRSRDLALAIRAATRAVELTDERDAEFLVTLARAYHLGAPRWAVSLQERAVRAASATPGQVDVQKLQRTLAEYRALVK